ncbi:MAG: hypothetical protein OXE58_09060, partial [Acidobacteria bacterium]|nr:hypothetical protein [Acidobacteriota bacterium]
MPDPPVKPAAGKPVPSDKPAPAAGARPATTGKPAPRRAAAAKKVTRREFPFLAIGWAMFTAAMAAGLTAAGRFMFPNVLTEPPSTFTAGFPEDFAIGVVDTR